MGSQKVSRKMLAQLEMKSHNHVEWSGSEGSCSDGGRGCSCMDTSLIVEERTRRYNQVFSVLQVFSL